MIYIIIILILIIIALFFVIKDKDKQKDKQVNYWKYMFQEERKTNKALADTMSDNVKLIQKLESELKRYHDAYYKSEEVRKKLYAERKQ